MGRYYYTDSGREGKFMFAVQPSGDPEEMGMHEQEPTSVDYYADKDDVQKITAKLDSQYDELGVDMKDRIYLLPQTDNGKDDCRAYEKWENEVLHDKVWESIPISCLTEEQKRGSRWTSPKGDGYVDIEIKDGKCLALARIRLALDILTDIEQYDFCSLNAEL